LALKKIFLNLKHKTIQIKGYIKKNKHLIASFSIMLRVQILVGVSTLSGANANFVKTNSPPISISNGHIPIKHRYLFITTIYS